MQPVRFRLTGSGLETETKDFGIVRCSGLTGGEFKDPSGDDVGTTQKLQVNLARVGLNNEDDASKSNENQCTR